MVREKTIIVGIMSNMSTMMTYIASAQFGILIFNDSYGEDQASKNYISNQISLYFLFSNLTVLFLSLGLGYLMDKIKNWKMIFFFHLLLITSIILFTMNAPTVERIYSADGLH